MKWQLAEIASTLGGELIGPDVLCHTVSTDSRQCPVGALFVALVGVRFDAHAFVPDVLRAGAAAALVSERAALPDGASGILVPDTRLALGALAAAWRARFDIPVIAITGSNGKTTTKEMVAAVLRAALGGDSVLATVGNLNNDIGLPLTLLGMHEGHRAAVVELGMNHPGEIAYLTRIARPTVALVNNAQRAHLEGMGDLNEVAREKGSIFEGLGADGVAVINGDDRFADFWHTLAAARTVRCFGLTARPGVDTLGSVRIHALETRLDIRAPEGSVQIELAMPGGHNARNALAAATACLAAGLPLSAVHTGLSGFSGVAGRLQRVELAPGVLLLDDTYNANPDSVRAGIDVLAATIGRKVLVLGDMGEIGEASGQYHDEIGGYAKSQGVDVLFALGEAAQQAVRNFGEGGRHFCQLDKLVSALKKELKPDTTLLVKGSRFMKMERVVTALRPEGNS